MITGFLHTGIEVQNIEDGIKLYESFGFKLVQRFDKPEPKAKAAHMKAGDGGGVELWEFIDKSHPLVELIRRHIALGSDDIEADVEAFKQQGCEVAIPVTQGVTMVYAYLRDPSGNYIELARPKS
jgi:catechol 2,3-dioxygenase-like lactoylglutathione lyase family enzyme